MKCLNNLICSDVNYIERLCTQIKIFLVRNRCMLLKIFPELWNHGRFKFSLHFSLFLKAFFVDAVLFDYHFLKCFYWFLEGEERGIVTLVREEHHQLAASCMPSTADQFCNSGMYTDWESNLGHFGFWVDTQPLSHIRRDWLLFWFYLRLQCLFKQEIKA